MGALSENLKINRLTRSTSETGYSNTIVMTQTALVKQILVLTLDTEFFLLTLVLCGTAADRHSSSSVR